MQLKKNAAPCSNPGRLVCWWWRKSRVTAGGAENTGSVPHLTEATPASYPKFSVAEKTNAEYVQRIDKLFEKGAKPNFQGVKILDRSDVLGLLGYGDKPVTLVESKVIQGKTNHPQFKAEYWKKIPQWLDDPALVFDSANGDGRLVFIAKELVDGNPAFMIMNPMASTNAVHLLINAYDKDGEKGVVRAWVKDGLLRYYSETENAALDRSRLQLPGLSQARRSDDLKIYRDTDLVKYRNSNPFKLSLARDSELPKQALKAFGRTFNANAAGYILPNGEMLDFSGKHYGDPGSTATRNVDHRELNGSSRYLNWSFSM